MEAFNANVGKSTTCYEVYERIKSLENTLIPELKGATVVVTGASAGIGVTTAQHLSYLGAHVVMACRNLDKAQVAMNFIKESDACERYGVKGTDLKLSLAKLDLGSLASVKTFTDDLVNKITSGSLPKIKLLVFNAGMAPWRPNEKSEDGLFIAFAVNHLGHFAIMRHLLNNNPQAIFSENGLRVVNVASEGHYGPYSTNNVTSEEELKYFVAGLETKEPRKKPKLGMIGAYDSSKLCNVYFAQSLNELKNTGGVAIKSCSLHPGGVSTDIMNDMAKENCLVRIIMKIGKRLAKTPDQGSSTTMTCCLMPDEFLTPGGYYDNCKLREPAKIVKGEKGKEAREALWQLSEDICTAFDNGTLAKLLPSWD